MVHRGKRSPEAKEKRKTRGFLWKVSYFDDEAREVICTQQFDYKTTMTREFDHTLFLTRFPFREYPMLEFAERGEVLINSRGEGTFQRR